MKSECGMRYRAAPLSCKAVSKGVSIALAVSNIGSRVCALWLVSDGRDGEHERAYRCGNCQNHIGLFVFEFELPLPFLFTLVQPLLGGCLLLVTVLSEGDG